MYGIHVQLVLIHILMYCVAAKSLHSCLTLCDPIGGSPPGSTIPGILQARTLEWVAMSFSSVWKWKVKVKLLSCVRLFTTPWATAYQVPLSMGFSRQEYWSGLPLPSPMPWWLSGKESACNAGDAGLIHRLGRFPTLEEEMITHSSILAWKIP